MFMLVEVVILAVLLADSMVGEHELLVMVAVAPPMSVSMAIQNTIVL